MEPNRNNKNRRRQRDGSNGIDKNVMFLGGFGQSRSICKAPRLDNEQLMELHSDENKSNIACISSAQRRQSEFLNMWLEQLEESSRAMPHEKLLQRVLELESELLDTQDKLKKANNALYRKKATKPGQNSPKIVSAPNSPLYSSPRYTPHASPMYSCSPIYQSPRYLVSPTAE